VPPIQSNDIEPAEALTEDAYEEINPGEYVLQTLFSEFTILAEKKIDRLLKESFVSLPVINIYGLFVCLFRKCHILFGRLHVLFIRIGYCFSSG